MGRSIERIMDNAEAAPYTGENGPELQIKDAREARKAIKRYREHAAALWVSAERADPEAKGYLYGALMALCANAEDQMTSIVCQYNPAYSWEASQTRSEAAKLTRTLSEAYQAARVEIGRGSRRALGLSA